MELMPLPRVVERVPTRTRTTMMVMMMMMMMMMTRLARRDDDTLVGEEGDANQISDVCARTSPRTRLKPIGEGEGESSWGM